MADRGHSENFRAPDCRLGFDLYLLQPQKKTTKTGQPVPSRNCTNPVAMQYNLGQQLGINGTPAIFAADGTQLGGYLPPAQLKATLDRMEGGSR